MIIICKQDLQTTFFVLLYRGDHSLCMYHFRSHANCTRRLWLSKAAVAIFSTPFIIRMHANYFPTLKLRTQNVHLFDTYGTCKLVSFPANDSGTCQYFPGYIQNVLFIIIIKNFANGLRRFCTSIAHNCIPKYPIRFALFIMQIFNNTTVDIKYC